MSTVIPSDVVAILVDERTPPAPASGTGVRTRFHLTLADGRRRRVRVDVYGNGGATPYVIRDGRRAYLSAAVEAMAYDRQAWADALAGKARWRQAGGEFRTR